MPGKPSFTLDSAGVDPAQVPQRTLYSGATIPAIGLAGEGESVRSTSPLSIAWRGDLGVR
jgi:hypothetical protein